MEPNIWMRILWKDIWSYRYTLFTMLNFIYKFINIFNGACPEVTNLCCMKVVCSRFFRVYSLPFYVIRIFSLTINQVFLKLQKKDVWKAHLINTLLILLYARNSLILVSYILKYCINLNVYIFRMLKVVPMS